MIRWQPEAPYRVSRRAGKRAAVGILGAVAIAAITVPPQSPHTPIIVYNASASLPLGYYRVFALDRVKVGDLVLLHTPESVRVLADRRRYLPSTVPMMKYVAALPGDVVCANDETILINGKRAALRRRTDRLGRPMPWWNGCHLLAKDDVFLLNPDAPVSFDGRYFGVVKRALLIGKLRRL